MPLSSFSPTRACRAFGLGLAALALALPGVAPAQKVCLIAEIDGAQEVPPNPSPAKGTAVFVVDTAANVLTYQITIEGLIGVETSAHIHGYAPPGANGGVKFALPLGATKAGIWPYPAADEAAILAGLAYVNIHTTTSPGGEVRGQMVRDPSHATLGGIIDGPQEPTGSPATGTGFFSVDVCTNTVKFQMTMTSSTLLGAETSAHIHGYAPPGSGAGVKFAMPPGFHKKGTWIYAEADEAALLGGGAYLNIHTSVFPAGEIRGQMHALCVCDPSFANYCTPGTSASGCTATLSATGIPSATCPGGFLVTATGVEGNKDGLFFYGTNGPQAVSWGNGTSFQCVTPPVKRGGLLNGVGTPGLCDGTFSQNLNARWCPTCPKPSHNPGVGADMQCQLWYRDPMNTSNQTTSLSDAIRWTVCP
jgi:hypothetical protein